jgi:hypothetical protein
MLYRPLKPTARLAAALGRAAGSVAASVRAFRKSGADTAYLQSASDHLLRDVGARRIEEPTPWQLIR